MSRADWTFLENLLEEGQEYSTGIGRVWLTVLFLFRMLVLATAAESAWDDEQADFVCNTRQPGCTPACYDKAFPISHFRFFVLQVIFVSTPTIFYFGYVAVKVGKEKKKEEEGDAEGGTSVRQEDKREEKKEEEDKGEGRRGRKAVKVTPEVPKLKGKLLCAYAASIFLKVLLEVGFMAGLWYLYDGFIIPAKFECVRDPCPHTVDCFVSRPTEKTIFTIYTQSIAGVSLLLNVAELFHLLQRAITQHLEKRYRAHDQSILQGEGRRMARPEAPVLEMQPQNGQHYLPNEGESGYPKLTETFVELGAGLDWGPGDNHAGGDILPSYLNCMGGMRTTHSPRAHHKKHTQSNGKHNKGARKGHSKQKHYV